MNQTAWMAAGVVLACGWVAAGGQGDPDAPELGTIRAPDISMDLSRRDDQPAGESLETAAKPERPVFGQAHTRWWTVGAGVAHNFADATDIDLRGAYSYFLLKNVEFSAELNAWYFHQKGPDAVGINPGMLLRWHFYDDGKWTLYGDAGVGLLLASREVPEGGTSFDLMPRIGGGFTRELDPETGSRLQVGLRWHHISNARISGAADNPSRDGVLLYAGIQFPF